MCSSCILRDSENTCVLFVEGFAFRATVCVLYFKGFLRIYMCSYICVLRVFSGLQKVVCTFCGGICVPRDCRATIALEEHIYSQKTNR